jgi:hypothetical protein
VITGISKSYGAALETSADEMHEHFEVYIFPFYSLRITIQIDDSILSRSDKRRWHSHTLSGCIPSPQSQHFIPKVHPHVLGRRQHH